MAIYLPLIYSGGFPQELFPGDTVLIPGELTAGSGFINQTSSLENDQSLNTAITPNASGVIFVGNTFGLTGADLTAASSALASGNAALAIAATALASGSAASFIANSALASGNAALLANASGIQVSSAAISISAVALASGNAAYERALVVQPIVNSTLPSGLTALASGNAALTIDAAAQASGNAALYSIINSPFLSEDSLIGLVIAIS